MEPSYNVQFRFTVKDYNEFNAIALFLGLDRAKTLRLALFDPDEYRRRLIAAEK